MNTINKSIFWDIGRTMTHNVLINFIVGNRGGGKSYGAKEKASDNFITRGEQFGYIRRYKDDLKKPLEQFWKDIAQEFPDYECKVEGEKVYIRLKPADEKQKWTEDDIAGYGFSLSTANNKKSMSFPKITMMIYDEFLLEEGNQRYLPNEVEKLLNLYETIARPGSGHPRVTLWLLGNAISVTNPYFLYWNLQMPKKKDKNGKWIWKHPTKPILVEDVRNTDFIDIKRKSEFGRLIDGTNYADYSIENKFLLDSDAFLEKRSQKAKNYFNFSYRGETFGVWIDNTEGKLWVSQAYDPSGIMYAFTVKDHEPNKLLFKSSRKGHFIKVFLESFKQGCLFFENMNIKNMCYEIFKVSFF